MVLPSGMTRAGFETFNLMPSYIKYKLPCLDNLLPWSLEENSLITLSSLTKPDHISVSSSDKLTVWKFFETVQI